MNFRKHISKNGTTFLAGKSAENNEELTAQVEKNEDVLHTVAPGSPFVNVKIKTKRGDLDEAAVFCGRYSKDWRENHSDVLVHVFKGKDIYKKKEMATGCFGVKKIAKLIKVKKEEIERFETKEK